MAPGSVTRHSFLLRQAPGGQQAWTQMAGPLPFGWEIQTESRLPSPSCWDVGERARGRALHFQQADAQRPHVSKETPKAIFPAPKVTSHDPRDQVPAAPRQPVHLRPPLLVQIRRCALRERGMSLLMSAAPELVPAVPSASTRTLLLQGLCSTRGRTPCHFPGSSNVVIPLCWLCGARGRRSLRWAIHFTSWT